MSTQIIVQPVNMAVTLDAARVAARINGTDSDGEIETDVRTFTANAEDSTNRAIINRTCRVTMDAFPSCAPWAIVVPASPLSSVVALKYIDSDGVAQTLDPADYIVDRAREPGQITPAPGLAWPATQLRPSAVNVDVICGYGPDSTTTPAAFKGYILGMVADKHAPAGAPALAYLDDLLRSMKVYA